jgi:hypothetical protein
MVFPEFGSDEEVFATEPLNGASNDLLGSTVSVALRRIDVVLTQMEGMSDGGYFVIRSK